MEEKGVATLERALTILAAFTEKELTLSLAEISRRTGLYKSTLLRLLSTLERFNYIGQQRDGNYHVGAAAFYLGTLYQRWVQPAEIIMPALQSLVDATGESASFNVREGDVRVCVYRIDSPHTIRDHIKVGDVLPLGQGAVGKILSAFSTEQPTEPAECVATTTGEIVPDMAAVSAPVFGTSGKCEGALAVTGPAFRIGEEGMQRARLAVLETASKLTFQLGGRSTLLEAALQQARST